MYTVMTAAKGSSIGKKRFRFVGQKNSDWGYIQKKWGKYPFEMPSGS